MARLVFQDENLSLEVEEGLSLLEIDEKYTTPLLFGCMEGNCGTCKIDVIKNPENISRMEENERSFLLSIDSKPSERLACQCKIYGDVTIALADFGTDEIL